MSLNGPSAPLCPNDNLELTCRLEGDPTNYSGPSFLQNGENSGGTIRTIDGVTNVLTLATNEYKNEDKFVCEYVHVNGETVSSNPYMVKKSEITVCLLYTSPSPRDRQKSRMPSSA